MPSFDSVNYAIRPNKAVERKITFSGLERLSRLVDLSPYRYIGLGSVWFVDFLMAHRVLGIKTMISIEGSSIGATRAEFNRPLACIEVVPGDTSVILPTLNLDRAPSLVWLDYDTGIGGPVIKDLELLCRLCAPNSVLIVTISAKKDDLPKLDEHDQSMSEEASLRGIAGDLVPAPLPPRRLQQKNYPKLLCEILANQFQNAVLRSGRKEHFVKLFDLAYTDSTPMVTVGGVIASPDKAGAIHELASSPSWEGIVDEPILVPPLTVKEKLALDRTLPSPLPPTDDQMARIGFRLKRRQLDAYHRHYLYYPMFGEVQF